MAMPGWYKVKILLKDGSEEIDDYLFLEDREIKYVDDIEREYSKSENLYHKYYTMLHSVEFEPIDVPPRGWLEHKITKCKRMIGIHEREIEFLKDTMKEWLV